MLARKAAGMQRSTLRVRHLNKVTLPAQTRQQRRQVSPTLSFPDANKIRCSLGAEKVGEIVADFTFLRDQGLIQPIAAAVDEQGRKIGKRHYKVTYTMLIQVVDRDLQCEFRLRPDHLT